jgi:hypothetical protein
MKLNRDFETEQQTGVCSYCGEPLELIETPFGDVGYATCQGCDEYDGVGQYEDDDYENGWLDGRHFDEPYLPEDAPEYLTSSGTEDSIPF